MDAALLRPRVLPLVRGRPDAILTVAAPVAVIRAAGALRIIMAAEAVEAGIFPGILAV